jgi:hypothetical protein
MRLLEDLARAEYFSELFTIYAHREGLGVGRPSGSLNSSCHKKKPEFFLVDGEAPMQPLFSPGAPSSAPRPPHFVLSWDPGNVAQLPCGSY